MVSDSAQQKRARLLGRFFLLLFLILVVRFFQLQVLSGSLYQERSERNSVRQVSVLASRGIVFDRHGRILVDNRPSYSLFIVPYEFRKNLADAMIVSSVVGLSVEEIEARIEEVGGGPFTPVRVIRDMDFETLSRIEENRLDLPGVFYQVEPVRTYPSGVCAAHVLGYLGEINGTELGSLRDIGYRRGDIIGNSGLERSYDVTLRGGRGYRYVEVDVRGREVGNFDGTKDVPPVRGRNLVLTLDSELQGFVEERIEGRRGAVVVLHPRNGEILAMVSKPDYNLEPFARGLSPEVWRRLRENPDKPLLHRAIQAQLPPGSTYKIVLAVAALEEGLVSLEEEVFCRGTFWLGRGMFQCWRPEGHGSVGLLDALKVSCNVFFYQLGLRVGLERWTRYGKHLGFGNFTQIDLVGESKGLLPNRRYLDAKYGKKGWGKGMMVNLSVGQGDLLATPLQMAQLAATIAMEGRLSNPHLVRSTQDPLTGVWKEIPPDSRRIKGVSAEVFALLEEGMFRVVNHLGGTGRGAWVPDVEVCGKTGTAQNPHGEDHAWFVGFAPRENSQIVVALVIENGGSGGGVAAPLAGEIFRWYFQKEEIS